MPVMSPVTLAAAGTATSTITITTTAHTAAALGFGSVPRNGRMLYTLLIVLLAGAVFTLRRASRNVRIGSLLMLLFVATLGITGCSSTSLKTSSNSNGTPLGTYSYTVTATSNGITRTQAVTVVVQ